jgi:hypothetical protein
MRRALAPLSRFIVTPRVAKHRLFAWLNSTVVPDSRLVVVARDDDTAFGILHSRHHELWSLRLGGRHGVGNDPQYTPRTGFEIFPFPTGLTPDRPAASYADDPRARAIAEAAKRLNGLREAWLNPPGLVERVPEVVPGFPERVIPRDAKAAAILKKRTLTNLYNDPPDWLRMAHRDLDAAVADAYGWPADLADEEMLRRLLALNLERAAVQDEPRQLRFHFAPDQLRFVLHGSTGEAPEKRRKPHRPQPGPDRRQRHFHYVIPGGLTDRLHTTIRSRVAVAA